MPATITISGHDFTKRSLRDRYSAYLDSCWRRLDDAYGSYSAEKEAAFERCERICKDCLGIRPKVVEANNFSFSYGFTTWNDGTEYFVYFTSGGDYIWPVRRDGSETSDFWEYEVSYTYRRNSNIEGVPFATIDDAREQFETECSMVDPRNYKIVSLNRVHVTEEDGETVILAIDNICTRTV